MEFLKTVNSKIKKINNKKMGLLKENATKSNLINFMKRMPNGAKKEKEKLKKKKKRI